MRETTRKIAGGEEYEMPAAIEAFVVFAEIAADLMVKGFPSSPDLA